MDGFAAALAANGAPLYTTLTYNGVEIGGGSLRIYRRDVQERVFDAIGVGRDEARDKLRVFHARRGYLMKPRPKNTQ